MVAFLKSDLFRNFMGGFILGSIAIFFMQPGNAQTNKERAPMEQAGAMTGYEG